MVVSFSGCVLTTLLLMQALDAHKYADQITSKFKQLQSIDPYRKGYYSDLCECDAYIATNTERYPQWPYV